MSPTLHGIAHVTDIAKVPNFMFIKGPALLSNFRAKQDNKSPWEYLGVNRNEHNAVLSSMLHRNHSAEQRRNVYVKCQWFSMFVSSNCSFLSLISQQ